MSNNAATDAESPRPTDPLLSADDPIVSRSQDLLGRAPFADAIANQILNTPATQGFVLGLAGPWGSGKTSILNLVDERLSDRTNVETIRFNPWLFSGTEQLVSRFFEELIAQLSRAKDKNIQLVANKLQNYAAVLRPAGAFPFVGKWATGIAVIGETSGRLLRRRTKFKAESVHDQRKELETALTESGKRLVVMIDDIDRLRADEIRDVVRLVRLTGHFPRTVYFLAFDRKRVEQFLSEEGIPDAGRAYLEKVVQVMHDIPAPREADLSDLLLKHLDEIVAAHAVGPFTQRDWTNVFHLAFRPLFSNLRDANRYLNALPTTLEVLGEEVALVDVLALEAVRVLLPDVYAQIVESHMALTNVADASFPMSGEESDREAIMAILSAAGSRAEAIRKLCELIFPAARRFLDNHHFGYEWLGTWRKNLRVAHHEILRIYLERGLPDDVPSGRLVREAFEALADAAKFGSLLESVPDALLIPLMERLEDFQEDYQSEDVEPASVIVLNQLPRLKSERGLYEDAEASSQLVRVVLRLFWKVDSEAERLAIAKRVLPRLSSLSARLELVEMLGHEEGVGHRLVQADEARKLERTLRQQILRAGSEHLVQERDLSKLLSWVVRSTPSRAQAVRRILRDDAVWVVFLSSAISDVRVQAVGEIALERHPRLPWDDWIETLGERFLVRRAREVAAAIGEAREETRATRAVELSVKYADGWRPRDV